MTAKNSEDFSDLMGGIPVTKEGRAGKASLDKYREERRAKGLSIGRPKGATNKLTSKIRNSLIKVYDELGGDEGMKQWAEKNPAKFYELYIKTAPKEKEGAAGAGNVTVVLPGNMQPVKQMGTVIEVDA